MPYQKIPKALRPLYLKGLPSSRTLKQASHLDLIANYPNSAYVLPKEVAKIEVLFKKHNAYGHMGMRHTLFPQPNGPYRGDEDRMWHKGRAAQVSCTD